MDTIQQVGEAINECCAPSIWEQYKGLCRKESKRQHYVLTSTERCCIIADALFNDAEFERMQKSARQCDCLWILANKW